MPSVTNNPNPNEKPPAEDPVGICYDDENITCHLPSNFRSRMEYYIDDVVGHHFSGVENVMAKEAREREYEGDEIASFYNDAYNVITPAKNQSKTDALGLLDTFIAENDNVAGFCTHESVLMNDIREMLTLIQAQKSLEVRGIGKSLGQACHLVAHETTIRYGDWVYFGWDMAGASSGNISPYVGGVGSTGTFALRPLESNVYTLNIAGAICEVEVVVEPACDIGFHSLEIEAGQCTGLLWNAEGNASASIGGIGGVDLKGVTPVCPTSTTTYTLTTSSGKTCSRELQVVPNLSCGN